MNKNSLIVNERFISLQGESSQAGRVCYFIRLSGCNLSCNYCDTLYAASGVPVEIDTLVEEAIASGVKLVEITGGEPLCQAGTPELALKLSAFGFEVMIETNGSMDISMLPSNIRRIVDCKLPGSGMAEFILWSNFEHLTPLDEVKFVISNAEDFSFALNVTEQYNLAEKCQILYSPVWGKVIFSDLAKWIVAANAPGKMQIQQHKIIWGEKVIGV